MLDNLAIALPYISMWIPRKYEKTLAALSLRRNRPGIIA
jgi:hypothetical protein